MFEGLATEPAAWICALARALPFTLLVPLGGRFVPRMVSLSLVLLLALTTWSVSLSGATSVENTLLVPRIAREVCIGLLLALACAAPLVAFSAVGGMADRLNAEALSGPYARLYELFALTMFFSLGGHRALVRALAHSVQSAPLGDLTFVRDRFFLGATALGSDAVLLSVSLALPLLAALWLSELALAWMTRAFSHENRPILGSPVRAIVALGVVLVSIVPGVDVLPDALRGSFQRVDELIRAAFG